MCSPIVANTATSLSALTGTGTDGFVKKGATSVSGIKVVNSNTLTFTMKRSMAMTTFENTYARYILTIPKHILGSVAENKIAKDTWFNHPTVVDGPYKATSVDVNHFISYTANTAYWKGAPKISKMNIKIIEASQIYAGLKSGEIDLFSRQWQILHKRIMQALLN